MRKFFVVSAQRSGSTWFCEKIAGMFGRWRVSKETNIEWWQELASTAFLEKRNLTHHYLPKPDYVHQHDPHKIQSLLNLDAFMTSDYKYIIRKTPQFYDDVYNSLNDNEFLNVMYDQCNLNEILNYPVIHFIRRDTIAQATSGAIASETDIYHNNKHYTEKIKNLKSKNIELNYQIVMHEAEQLSVTKRCYHDILSKYHKNCLTVYYENCLDENYWKTTLNDKLENFMQDSIQKPEYQSENQMTREIYNIVNSDGTDWHKSGQIKAVLACEQNNLPVNSDSLAKLFKFPINRFRFYHI